MLLQRYLGCLWNCGALGRRRWVMGTSSLCGYGCLSALPSWLPVALILTSALRGTGPSLLLVPSWQRSKTTFLGDKQSFPVENPLCSTLLTVHCYIVYQKRKHWLKIPRIWLGCLCCLRLTSKWVIPGHEALLKICICLFEGKVTPLWNFSSSFLKTGGEVIDAVTWHQ